METFFFYYIFVLLCIITLLILRYNVYNAEVVYDRQKYQSVKQKCERRRFPIIFYIIGSIATFVPVCNIIFFIASVIYLCVEFTDDNITFSGWLFKEV